MRKNKRKRNRRNMVLPLNELSPVELEKTLKFGMRKYSHCAETLERLCDFDAAIYDQKNDLFFKNQMAYSHYYSLKKGDRQHIVRRKKYKQQAT